jgi:CBS domain-containing protein
MLMQTDLITVAPDTPFLQIQRLFVVAQISGAPVVDDRGAVLGVISSVDLLRVVDQACDDDLDMMGPLPAEESNSPRLRGSMEIPEQLESITAIDFATPGAVWVSPEDSISQVAHLMRTEGIHRVLVGHDQRLAGILTTFDLLKAIPS